MRRLALAFLFCLISPIANAQTFQSEKPVVCDVNPEKVIKALIENYEENPVWVATGEGAKFTLFVNKDTGSWTLLQFTSEWACIIGIGKNSILMLGQPV